MSVVEIRTVNLGLHPAPAAGRVDSDPSAVPPAVPGYQILGELGRGGNGIVYKALQLDLGRTVALKTLDVEANRDPESRQRFRTEATAVARLEHPHIVRLYDVGEADGRLYFVLEYVDGGTLADRLLGKPQEPREAAALVEQLARAMHYAHQRGVIHRDLKPANVLLQGLDVSGQAEESSLAGSRPPKITDFGIAKCLGSDGTQTQTGVILGTPSYMAPEQAEGGRARVGPATDVYALGAILYEMLGGRAPFQGVTVLQTLQLIRFEDPVPPRRLQPKVPRDLETVCLKCLEKDPQRRYPSAEALADDLGRFLRDEPVRARPTSTLGRAVKWVKRRPAVAALAGACVLALAALVGVGLWHHYELADYSAQLEEALHDAERQKEVAQRQTALAGRNADKALRALDEAKTQKERAEVNARAAHEKMLLTVETFKTLVGEVQVQLGTRPGLMPLQKTLLDTALRGLNKVADSAAGGEAGEQRAIAHLRLGDIFLMLGKLDEADKQFAQAREAATRAAAEQPRAVLAQADAHDKLGDVQLHRGDAGAARQHYETAVRLREGRNVGRPRLEDVRGLAVSLGRLGDLGFRGGDLAGAEKDYARSLAVLEDGVKANPELAGELLWDRTLAHGRLGDVALRQGDPKTAGERYRRSLACLEGAAPEDRDTVRAVRHQAELFERLGRLHETRGEYAEARGYYEKCQRVVEKWAADDPANVRVQRGQSVVRNHLGDVCKLQGDLAGAEKHYAFSVGVCKKLVQTDPASGEFKQTLAFAWMRLAEARLARGELAAAREAGGPAVELMRGLAKTDAKNGESLVHLATYLCWLGGLERRALRHDAARALFEESLAVLDGLTAQKRFQSVPTFRRLHEQAREDVEIGKLLAKALEDLELAKQQPGGVGAGLLTVRAVTLTRQGRHEEAEATLAALRERAGKDARATYRLARAYGLCAEALAAAEGEKERHRRYAEAAGEALAGAVKLGFGPPGRVASDDVLAGYARHVKDLPKTSRLSSQR